LDYRRVLLFDGHSLALRILDYQRVLFFDGHCLAFFENRPISCLGKI
jgi:hypothetical protein